MEAAIQAFASGGYFVSFFRAIDWVDSTYSISRRSIRCARKVGARETTVFAS